MTKSMHIFKALIYGLIAGAVLSYATIATAQFAAIGTNQGGTGTVTAPTAGQVLVGQTGGTYSPQATSSLGLLSVVTTSDITDDTILEVDFDVTNSPTDNYVLSYDSGTGGFTWVADQTGGGAGSGTVATSTPLVDTYVTYATGVNTIGAESTFTYDDATDLLTVGSLTTTATATVASLVLDSGIANATSTIYSEYGKFNIGSSTLETLLFNFTGINQVTISSLSGVTSWIFSGIGMVVDTFLEIPNGTAPTVNSVGELALDTTDNHVVLGDSGNSARVIARTEQKLFAFTVASTSPEFVSGGVIPAPAEKDGFELTQYRCYVDGGTSVVVNMSDGTNDTETITCATSLTSDTDVATNDTFTAGELAEFQIGTITGTPDYLSFTAYGYWTRE